MMSDELLRCRSCRGRTSLTAGTIFEGTRKPLRTWFMAMWFVTSQKNGVSALGLQRVLGLGSYETAWTWLHKLRRAMVRPGRDRLRGAVEVDETYVGGAEKGKWGREVESKAIVAVAAEEDGKGIGRIRLRRIADVSAGSLLPFVREGVAPGTIVHTDGWKGYAGLAEDGFKHKVSVISAGPDAAHVVMPRVHRVAALFKRWLLGTHQGGVKVRHLDYYLDEFTFRFNRRRSKARGLLFHRLAEQAVAVQIQFREITPIHSLEWHGGLVVCLPRGAALASGPFRGAAPRGGPRPCLVVSPGIVAWTQCPSYIAVCIVRAMGP